MRRSLSLETQITGATQSASFTDPFKPQEIIAGKGAWPGGQGGFENHFHWDQSRPVSFHERTVPSRWDDSSLLRPSHTLSGKEIAGTKGESEYEEFSVRPHSISGSSCIPNHPSDRDEEPVRASPTDSQRRLMFDHRVQLKHIREQDRSGWRNWQREWDRRMTSA